MGGARALFTAGVVRTFRSAVLSQAYRPALRQSECSKGGAPGTAMSFLQDLRFAVRLLVKDRWFTAVAVIALALGHRRERHGVHVRERGPHPRPALRRSRPHSRRSARATPGAANRGASYLDFEDWRAATRTFAGLAAFSGQTMNVSDEGRAPERFQGPYLSANAFKLIGQPPLVGRDFLPEDDRPGAAAGGDPRQRHLEEPLRQRPRRHRPHRSR